ncbi:MAG: hypothetical protein DRH57_07245 [Candidatus Cloacimonadota bacterium]|nr:MAG: hypothetical protein DRH57_07245 [Candidatus Cloacimonadota bacterium]
MKENKITNIDDIIASVNTAFSKKSIDRTEHIEEISECLMTLGKSDMRVGQAFENIRSKYGGDLFNMENDKLLELFKELITPSDK